MPDKGHADKKYPSWLSLSHPVVVSSATALSLLVLHQVYTRFGKRVLSVDHLSVRDLSGQRTLTGIVTSVGDADNFRLLHRPPLRWTTVPERRADLKGKTIHVRLAGVDAPELAHFGKPAQPYSREALECLKSLVLGKQVRVKLLSRDQYGRVVGMAYVRRFPWLLRGVNVSEEMLRAGLACVYTAGNAQYGNLHSKFERLERQARSRRKGMWAQSSKAYESPADYKKRTAQSS